MGENYDVCGCGNVMRKGEGICEECERRYEQEAFENEMRFQHDHPEQADKKEGLK